MEMTALEMLDALTSGIERLRAERDQLASALSDAERRLNAVSEKARPRKRRSKVARPSKRRKPRSGELSTQPAVPETKRVQRDEGSSGKRQALGKRLGELRNRPKGEQAAGVAEMLSPVSSYGR
jgi:hypothetical protein